MKEKVLKGNTNGVITLSQNALSSISKLAISEKSMTSRRKRETTNFPEYPSWVHERLNLSWDFYPSVEKFESDCEINKLSLTLQEDMVVDDLLNCMCVSNSIKK